MSIFDKAGWSINNPDYTGISFAEGVIYRAQLVWNTNSLTWVKMTQPGGGGGGAVTIADGADVAQGTTSDAAWVSGSGTVIALLKKIASAGGSAVSIADGSDVAEGATTDAAVVSDANGTLSGKIRGLVKIFASVWDSTLGRINVAIPDYSASGTINALNGTVALVLNNKSGTAIDVRGTWNGTLSFQGTVDGTNYVPVWGFIAGDQQIYEVIDGNTQTDKVYRFTTAGFVGIRAIMTGYVSGTATITIRASTATSGVYQNFPLVAASESTLNSTTVLLGSNGVFTGGVEDLLNYVGVQVTIYTDQNSAANGLSIQYSSDGTNWDLVDTYSITASAGFLTVADSNGRYFRVVYTNGAVAQGVFRLKCIKRNAVQIGDVVGVGAAVTDLQSGILTKSIIVGKTTAGGGAYIPVKVNPSGAVTAAVTAADGDVFVRSASQTTFPVTAYQGGTWSGVGVTGTFWQATQPVSIDQSNIGVTNSVIPKAQFSNLGSTYANNSWNAFQTDNSGNLLVSSDGGIMKDNNILLNQILTELKVISLNQCVAFGLSAPDEIRSSLS